MCIRFSFILDIRFRSRYLKYHKAVKKKSLAKPYKTVYVCLYSIAGIREQQYRKGYLWNYSDCMMPRNL